MNTEQWLIYTLQSIFTGAESEAGIGFLFIIGGATMDHLASFRPEVPEVPENLLFVHHHFIYHFILYLARMITANLAGGLGGCPGSRQPSLPGSRRGSNNQGLPQVRDSQHLVDVTS